MTVYVVRSSWRDTRNLITVTVDGGDAVETLPYSMIRMRLRPGTHQIAFEFEGKRNPIDVSGAAGDVRFVRIGGEVGVWGSSYSWEHQSEEKIRKRATKTRLVADIRILSDHLQLNSGAPSSTEM